MKKKKLTNKLSFLAKDLSLLSAGATTNGLGAAIETVRLTCTDDCYMTDISFCLTICAPGACQP